MMLPLLILLAPALAQDDLALDPGDALVVRVPLRALEPRPTPPPAPPVDLVPGRLDVQVQPGDESRLRLSFEFQLLEGGPVSLPVVGSNLTVAAATLDGRPVALPPDPDGWRRLAADLAPGAHRLVVQGSMPTPTPSLVLPILTASRGTVTVADGWELHGDDAVRQGPNRLDLLPTDTLDIGWRRPLPPAPRPQVVQADAATSLRVDATGIEARARVRFRVRHQPAEQLRIQLPAVAELSVEGPALARWERQGGDVVLFLTRPMTGEVQVELSWRADAPGRDRGRPALPLPQTTSGRLDDGWISVLAGDQGTPVVDAGGGLEPVPGARVAAWGRGLVPGAPLLALAITGPRPDLGLRVLDLTPAEEPPTFVDEAEISVAHAAHGRSLLRCRYQVRNDKSQYLGLRLPARAQLLGVRVAGRVVQPVVSDGGQTLSIPLEKSVETFQGLVTFPVEVMLLVDEAPWDKRGERQLQAPAVDAPVAFVRWEVLLPPGVVARKLDGPVTPVGSWSPAQGGLQIGRATALGVEPEEEKKAEQSQEAWNLAYRAYQDNEFEQAEVLLEQSLQLDADNRAAQALKENVDVLLGNREATGEEERTRRIRSLARAKTQDLAVEQAELEEDVEQASRAGDDAELERLLSRYETVTGKLAQVEDTEAVEQKSRLEAVKKRKQESSSKADGRDDDTHMMTDGKGQPPRSPPPPPPPPPAPSARITSGSAQDTVLFDELTAAPSAIERYDGDDDISFDMPDDIAGELVLDPGEFAIVLDSSDGVVGGVEGGQLGGAAYGAAAGADFYQDAPPEEAAMPVVEAEPAPEAPMEPPAPPTAAPSNSRDFAAEIAPARQAQAQTRAQTIVITESLAGRSYDAQGIDETDAEWFEQEEAPERASSRVRIRLPSFGASKKSVQAAPPPDAAAAAPTVHLHPLGPTPTAPPRAPAVANPRPTKPPPPPPPPGAVPSALQMDAAVTAAPLITNVPRAGARVLLEQRLLAPDQALHATLTYRLED